MSRKNIDLGSLKATVGFRIAGETEDDRAGISVSSAGDVNGDGIDDLIIGANTKDRGGSDSHADAGGAYVIYGRDREQGQTFTDIDLADLPSTAGFRIAGATADGQAGISVSSAGDVNNDGIDDLIVGAYGVNGLTGAAYVIYGRDKEKWSDVTTIDLAELSSTAGFRIAGGATNESAGISVSNAGDVNGDGISDMIIGASSADSGAGAAYVIYGRDKEDWSDVATIDLANLKETEGFRIAGTAQYDKVGFSVSSAGDVNGDEIDDFIVGANGVAGVGGTSVGAAYVIYGKDSQQGQTFTDIDLSSLEPSEGFRIAGAEGGDYAGYSVSRAGDVNGDRIDDLIVGAYGANGRAGAAYVIYGNAAPVLAGERAGEGAVGAPVAVAAGLTITDKNHTTLASATITIQNYQAAGGALILPDAGVGQDFGNITTEFDPVTGTLGLTSADAAATLEHWQAALRAVSYTSDTAGSISFAITVNDGIEDSADDFTTSVTFTGTEPGPGEGEGGEEGGSPNPPPTPVPPTPVPPGPVIIPTSVVPVVVTEAPELDADGRPKATEGIAGSGSVVEIQSGFSTRMGSNADNMALTGTAGVNGWDNADDNVIYGNAGANTLYLSGGNDIVEGGSGFDRLVLAGSRKDYAIAITKGVALITNTVTGETIKAAGITSIGFGNSGAEKGLGADAVAAQAAGTADTSYGSSVNSEIDGLYKAYYGREATNAEYAGGVARLQKGSSLQDLAAELAVSSAGQQHLRSEGSDAAFVESLYAGVLGRASDAEGLSYWAGELENGNLTRSDVALSFATSDEYGDSYLNLFAVNQSDVEGLYLALLGRGSDKDGFGYYLEHSANGDTLEVIAQSIVQSDEFSARIAAKSATEFLEELYNGVLKREADADGIAYWQDRVDEGADIADIAISFVTSEEFQTNTDLLLSRNGWIELF